LQTIQSSAEAVIWKPLFSLDGEQLLSVANSQVALWKVSNGFAKDIFGELPVSAALLDWQDTADPFQAKDEKPGIGAGQLAQEERSGKPGRSSLLFHNLS
jgi:hypothetical protein